MIRHQWSSLTRHQRAVLIASTIVAGIAACLWLLSLAVTHSRASEATSVPPATSASGGVTATAGQVTAAPAGSSPAARRSNPASSPAAGTTSESSPEPQPRTSPRHSAQAGGRPIPAQTPAVPPEICTLFQVADSHGLTLRDGQILLLAPAQLASGPGLAYRGHPPMLRGDRSDMAFQITFLFLGHRTLDSTPPEALPQPGQRHFAPVLSGATL